MSAAHHGSFFGAGVRVPQIGSASRNNLPHCFHGLIPHPPFDLCVLRRVFTTKRLSEALSEGAFKMLFSFRVRYDELVIDLLTVDNVSRMDTAPLILPARVECCPQSVEEEAMLRQLSIPFLLSASVIWPVAAEAQDCSPELFKATTDYAADERTNLSIAWNMSEEAYEEAKKNAGGKAIIKGVPIGANYNEFKSNVKKKAESLGIENFEKRSIAYATSGIGQNGLDPIRTSAGSRPATTSSPQTFLQPSPSSASSRFGANPVWTLDRSRLKLLPISRG